jgi:alpha-L-rhamnosidase
MYSYLGGIKPDLDKPGFKHVIIQPCFVSSLDWGTVSHRSKYGVISLLWRRNDDDIELTADIPEGVTAVLILPARQPEEISFGKYTFKGANSA